MMKDLKVTLENRPGTLADLSEALGKAGVNIEGIAGFAREVRGSEDREFVTHVAHILVDDATPAKKALVNAGIKIEDEREALVIDIRDRPGELAAVTRRLSESGINIEYFYTATRTRMVLGVTDTEKACKLLGVRYPLAP
ncbi:MAG: ACT domain-containing protein [Candidatus Bathyarchaeota archaeon]|nr:ACT domain-containing protein [Candidatus Bathyarchaeota archaeon]